MVLRERIELSASPLPRELPSQNGEGDGTGRHPNDDGRPRMVGRGTDWDEQIGASGHVERLAVRSDGEGKRLMRDRNGGARRVGGHPDRCHGVATRVEDVE
jgi:hypothetical protein